MTELERTKKALEAAKTFVRCGTTRGFADLMEDQINAILHPKPQYEAVEVEAWAVVRASGEVLSAHISRALLVIRHAWQMYRNLTLPRNLAKGDWRGLSQQELLRLLMVEYEELYVEVYRADRGTGSAQRVAEEAADVSAYAAMLADSARRGGCLRK